MGPLLTPAIVLETKPFGALFGRCDRMNEDDGNTCCVLLWRTTFCVAYVLINYEDRRMVVRLVKALALLTVPLLM
jgi:hypothetical protein